jgi:hypothetical protein
MTITGVGRRVIVTMSREYGALGRSAARATAERLRYRLVDDELPVVVAARLGTSPDVIESAEVSGRSIGDRFLQLLGPAVPEAFGAAAIDDDLPGAAQREVERLITEAADAGDVVIVGRCANVLLAGRPDLVRVFLRAPLEWRVARVRSSLAVDEPTAKAEIARVDGGRRAFAHERYGINWGDPQWYDLVIDVSGFGSAGTAALVAAAVEARA